MPTRKEPALSVQTMVIILTSVTLTGFGIFSNNAQGQGNLTKGNVTIGNVTLTPEQVAAICDPNNPKLNFVNTTESKLCGIPKTIQNTTSTANITTGAEAPPSTTPIAPSAVP
jgi:hypothetical protein